MITEFNFQHEEGGTISDCWLTFYSENFPIDLQIGDELWIVDFIEFFKKGQRYSPEFKISNESITSEEFEIPEATVVDLRYGYENDKVIKILGLQAT
jgi:hypothetical protein